MTSFKFLWNGIKVDNGKLQRGSYSRGTLIGYPKGTITIYAKTYSGFSAAVWEAFNVQNDSDCMTDYFETDRICVCPDHPLYAEVANAAKAAESHYDKMRARPKQRRLAAA
jgi:hypothetical protein